MASTYSDLKIELIGTGEQVGEWGTTTNTNLGTAIGEAITGSATVTFASADETLTLTNTNASQTARNLRIVCTGTSGGARNLILGSGCQIEKLYIIQNDLADNLTVKNTTGTGVVVPAGAKALVYNNATNVIDALTPAGFDTGTRMIFAQTTAPTGFTKDTSNYNNHALRVVTGTASTGGTIDFTTAFASKAVTGTVSTSVTANTGQVAQGGNISVSTGQAAAPGSIGPTAAPIGQAAGPVSIGNAASPNGPTTLAVPTIPAHSHLLQRRPADSEGPFPNGFFSTQNSPDSPAPIGFTSFPNLPTTNTGGGAAHTHPAGNHVHPASGGQHVHPSPAHTHPFSGGQHAHPASGNFSGSQHAHPVSAPATSNFSGTAINLAVKYLDVITATKD
jgi:hypothetical protein